LKKFLLLGIILYSFPHMSFHMVSHEKVFNEAIYTKDDVSLLIFLWGFYKRDKKDIYYVDCVSSKLSLRVYRSSSQHTRSSTFIFPIGFLKDT
jgi:hypothetical protein